MEIIYVISVISLLILFMLIKKSDKKLNGFGIFGLGVVLLLAYNVLECYALNFFKIKLTLLNLSIVNIFFILLGTFILIKKKEIQKYHIELGDLIFTFILGMVIFIIGGINYGYPLNIKYTTTDPATHYRASYNFATSESLMNNEPDKLWGFENFKTASYVNSGLIMKVFSNVMESFYYYKIFIIFGLFILFLTGYIMYFAFIKISKGKIPVIAVIFSLLYTLGYPLNSLAFGFEYMSMGILVITTLLYAVSYYTTKEIKLKYIIPILFLLNFQLFQAYYQFIPYIYSALFVYICFVNYKEDKKIFTKKNILTLLITLIIPFILGYIYYMSQNIYNMNFGMESYAESIDVQKSLIGGFKMDGFVYNNLYSNYILLLPLVIFVIIRDLRKDKHIAFSSIAAIFAIGYITLLVIGNINGMVSDYYATKNYFALWPIIWYVNFKGIYYLYQNKKVLPYIITGAYICLLIFGAITFKIEDHKNKLKVYEFRPVGEVYYINWVLIYKESQDFLISELEMMKFVKENLDKTKKIEMLGTEQQILWAYPLLDYYYEYPNIEKRWFQSKLTYKYKNNKIIENADYIICIKRSAFFKNYDSKKLEKLEVIYENEFGKVLKR